MDRHTEKQLRMTGATLRDLGYDVRIKDEKIDTRKTMSIAINDTGVGAGLLSVESRRGEKPKIEVSFNDTHRNDFSSVPFTNVDDAIRYFARTLRSLKPGMSLRTRTYPHHGEGERLPLPNPAGIVMDGKSHEFKHGATTISYSTGRGVIYIDSVRTPTKAQRKGSARAAMTEFLRLADEEVMVTELEASPLTKATSRPRLVRFYSSLGFVPTGKLANSRGDPQTRRPPVLSNPAGTTPLVLQHVVVSIAAKNPDYDTQRLFAIATAAAQRSGYLKPGTRTATAKGRAKERSYSAAENRATEKAFEHLVKP